MSLNEILAKLDAPVKPATKAQIMSYMKDLPSEHNELTTQCVEYLETHDTLQGFLVVVHALNAEEFMLKCLDEDTQSSDALSEEFEKLMSGDEKKTPTPALTSTRAP